LLAGSPRCFKTLPELSMPAPPTPAPPLVLRLIALAKLAKGLALAGLALGLFHLAHRNLDHVAEEFIAFARISPENRYARLLLERAGLVKPDTLVRAGIGSAIYAAILLSEGIGLWVGAWWAEYVVVVSTGVFVPEELLACFRHFTWPTFAVLAVNGAILAYVVRLVWRRIRHRRMQPG
jgi:uncharacterized membrane protein (DUF2068 family)